LGESGNFNHRFDAAGLRFKIRGEILDDAVEVRPVGDPRVGVDLPLLDHLDDLLQLLPRGVPGAHDRQLAAVEVRVVEADVELAEADEHQPAAVRDVLERLLHRLLVARAVEHRRGELLAADRLHLREDVPGGVDDVLDPEVLLAELQALPVDVGDHDPGARGLRELDRGKADRARADDERPFAPLDVRAVHGVRADAERFHEGELLAGEPGGGVKLVRRHGEELTHAAVGVDAETLEFHAAVGLAVPARDALAAGEVRLDGAEVAGLQPGHLRADFDHFDSELVAEPARGGEERLLAAEGVQISPADPEAPNLHQRFALLRLPGMSGFAGDEPAWLLEDYLFHGSLLRDDLCSRRPAGAVAAATPAPAPGGLGHAI